MKKLVLAGLVAASVLVGNLSADCKYSVGDEVTKNGKYLYADSCKLYGNIEEINKNCTKAKVRISKITAAFGIQVNATCRYDAGEGAAGDIVWMNL